MNQYEQVHHREEVWTSQLVPLLPRGRQHQRSPYWSPQVLYNTTVSRFEQLKRDVRRGVEFGIETKALLYKRMCAYAGLHAIVIKGFCKVLSSDHSVDFVNPEHPGKGVQAFRGVCGQPLEERLERRLRCRRLATRPTKLGGHASADQGGETFIGNQQWWDINIMELLLFTE